MKKTDPKTHLLILVHRCEKYFYKYLLARDKVYIDRFFSTSKRAKRFIERNFV